MKIVTVRRICQVFFLLVFLWFCVTSTLGDAWWQLRGWPVNWFLQLDPLVGLGVLLTTHTLYKGLLWGLVTVVLTILLGRFFCGWACPLGAVNQFVGFIGRLKKSIVKKADSNRYHKAQAIKYWLLIFLLASGAVELVFSLIRWPRDEMFIFWIALLLILIGTIGLALLKLVAKPKKMLIWLLALAGTWFVLSLVWGETRGLFASLQTGLLDPLPLFYRSVNLALLPIIDGTAVKLSVSSRFYEGAWFIGSIFISIVFLNLKVPRFYCRFICPLGALFGVLVRFSIWRIEENKRYVPAPVSSM